MKQYIFCLLLFLLSVQLVQAQNYVFIRVYNSENKKINKGHFWGTTDSSVYVYRGKNLMEIPVNQADHIRTKRSLTHRIVVTVAAVTVVVLFIWALASNKNGIHPLGNGSGRRDRAGNQFYKIPRRFHVEHERMKWREQRLFMDTIFVTQFERN